MECNISSSHYWVLFDAWSMHETKFDCIMEMEASNLVEAPIAIQVPVTEPQATAKCKQLQGIQTLYVCDHNVIIYM